MDLVHGDIEQLLNELDNKSNDDVVEHGNVQVVHPMVFNPEDNLAIEHDDPGPPVLIEQQNFDQHGFITYDGLASLVEIGRIPEDLAGSLYEQSINVSQYYRETYLPELGPSAWIGHHSSNVQYSPRKGTWMRRHSYEKINDNGQQEYAYCWIHASEDNLSIDYADISAWKNEIASTMSMMIKNYNINQYSYYTDILGCKRRTKLAVE